MINIDYVRRRARGGTGVIPPNNTQWENEHHALDVREDLGVGPDDPLRHPGRGVLLREITGRGEVQLGHRSRWPS